MPTRAVHQTSADTEQNTMKPTGAEKHFPTRGCQRGQRTKWVLKQSSKFWRQRGQRTKQVLKQKNILKPNEGDVTIKCQNGSVNYEAYEGSVRTRIFNRIYPP